MKRPQRVWKAVAIVLAGLVIGGFVPAACAAGPARRPAPVKNGPARAAVFFQPGFPYYGVSAATSPPDIARNLQRAGIRTDLLDADVLADPTRFNAGQYTVVVLPYGNAYPQPAFANLRAFHRAGGGLVLSGVPFTHPCAPLTAAGWSASPDWGTAVHTTSNSHSGRRALELVGQAGNWVGVSTPRTPVSPGQTVTVSGWVSDVTGANGGDDWLFVRFNDRNGRFPTQQGAALSSEPGWHRVSATVMAPPGASYMDLAPQVRTPGRTVRLDDLSLMRDGKPVPLANPGFEQAGKEWVDLGHHSEPALFGPDGIGVGGFSEASGAAITVAPGDPFDLRPLRQNWNADGKPQTLDPGSLPPGADVVPALLEGNQPVAALIVHHDASYPGAVDAWTNHPSDPDTEPYDTEQLLTRATAAVMARKGVLSRADQQQVYAMLDRLPRPRVFANLTLPILPRPYPTFQPTMRRPARRLYVADVGSLSHDEKILLISLQGIVNARQPRIYLVMGDDDRFWLNWLRQTDLVDAPILVKDPFTLLQTFRQEIRGAVVPDPKVYESPCVAVDLAGADHLVIATPALARRFALPIRQDLRGRFADDAAALRYVRTKLWSRLNPFLSICLDPAIMDSGAIDAIIAARGSCFWITGPKAQDLPGANMPAERLELEETLAQMPLNAVVRGFWWHGDGVGLDEGAGVSLGSRFGKVTVVSDYVSNFSVLGGFAIPKLTQKAQPPAPPLDRSKAYVAITMSDGDNLTTWRGYFRRYFEDPLHGTFPVGWGMGPTLIDCAPPIAQWYYDHAAPTDEFLCDVSGVGYIYPPDWATALKDREGAFASFYDWTQRYMHRMDMHTVRLMNVRTQDIPHVASLLPQVHFLMPDYGYAGEKSYVQLTYPLPSGQAVFRAATTGSGPENLAQQIRSRVGATRPAFVNAFIWNWGSSLADLKKMLDLLGPDYVAVTPSQLNTLYRQAR